MEYTRISNDVNGNPRYVLHFLDCEPTEWKDYTQTIPDRYARTTKLMNRIGGRKYSNKRFGGGIVFQSFDIRDTLNVIAKLRDSVSE